MSPAASFGAEARDDLPRVENALLWAMRAWVIGHCRGIAVEDRIGRVFAELGAPGAMGYLSGFMWALSHGATRTLEVNCVCHPGLSRDESALLDVIALEQEGYADEALALLRGMATARAASVVCDSARGMALALQAAGRILPRGATVLERRGLGSFAWLPDDPAGRYLH